VARPSLCLCQGGGVWHGRLADLVWAKWETGGTDGTYYSGGDQMIHLADQDCNSRDTVVHEAQHSYMDDLYAGWPVNDCTSPHYIQYISGCGCALSEGWTYAVVSGADCNPVYTWPSGSTLNLETPTAPAPTGRRPGGGGRVAGVLIDMMDPFWCPFGPAVGFASENAAWCGGDDRWGDSFDAVWSLFYDQDDDVFVVCDGYTNTYSNAWEGRLYPRQAPERIGNLNTINTFTTTSSLSDKAAARGRLQPGAPGCFFSDCSRFALPGNQMPP